MGFCIACFLRDIAGALGLQNATATTQSGETVRSLSNFRPEIVGIVLGACLMAMLGKEFKPKGGSSPFTRFLLGVLVMMGALVFLGCPLRMVIRIGGGDMNAIVGLFGFVIGILIGIFFLRRGFSLGRAYRQTTAEGLVFPVILLSLFVLSQLGSVFYVSEAGPGVQSAKPWIVALLVAVVVGALAQRSRLCMVGGIRDAVMFREFGLLAGFGGVIVAVMLGNILVGNGLKFSFDAPVAHSEWLWNMLGMTLVGWGCCLLGGCPLRQLVLAGEGNTDSAITVMGMLLGGALSHTLKIASSASGTAPNGRIAVVAGFALVLLISLVHIRKGEE